MEQNQQKREQQQKRAGRGKLFLVLAVCAAPLVASYFTYYVIKPSSRTNYGTLLDPRKYPIPALASTGLDGSRLSLQDYQGKWLMVQVNDADCRTDCRKRLNDMRQLRLAQGKEMDRIERVWLITDDQPPETMLLHEYDGMRYLRVPPQALQAWLPVEQGALVSDHIYLIDPLGNLMMRYPKDADPSRIKKDLAKLLKASAIG
ncbi:cytochrome c oxidase subunit I [Herminiimonas sp. CN]|uniref:SCO family protein n=1 Tax=Herminiimonas sp. CN TaxID=1349818 RepID=UPI00047389F1|nr:cytochrome c oxidase subunit I [Herminiimonas sp. CN]